MHARLITVQIQHNRSGIELFSENYVRDELYPIIRAAEIYIKPPAKVAISAQFLRIFKGDKSNPLFLEQLMTLMKLYPPVW